jgi:predicted nucleotidyltransferase
MLSFASIESLSAAWLTLYKGDINMEIPMQMLSKDTILETLRKYKGNDMLKDIRVGLAGSYARGEASENSDVDILIDGDSHRINSAEFLRNLFPVKTDILWLELLKEDDEKDDEELQLLGFGINKYSLYKTLLKDAVWI